MILKRRLRSADATRMTGDFRHFFWLPPMVNNPETSGTLSRRVLPGDIIWDAGKVIQGTVPCNSSSGGWGWIGRGM